MDKFETNGQSGFYSSDAGVVTFEVQGAAMRESIAEKEYHNLYARYLNENRTMQLQGYTVPIWGKDITYTHKKYIIRFQITSCFPRFYKNKLSSCLVAVHWTS